jgi:hypothetical protein
MDSKIFKKLLSCIKKASLEVNKIIQEEAKILIEKEQCWLNNTYNDTISTYEFYKEKLTKSFDELDIEKIKNDVDLINLRWEHERIRRHYLFGFIASFFSRLESIMHFLFCFIR